MKNDLDKKLHGILDKWNPDIAIPGRFRSDVWTMIAARQEARESTLWFQLSNLIEQFSFKPAFAYATCTIAIVFGLFIGFQQTARIQEQFKSHYVQSVDPYVQTVRGNS